MSVFDRELIINGKAVRSPEQQVYKNMKDIEALQEIIKPEYKTEEALTSSSVSVAIDDTNAPEGTTEGWLLTSDGLKFKITGGDETNLLLEFYADLKGPQGESGAAVNIDDTGTSLTKVWSSKKVSDTIDLIRDKGIYYTLVQPTLDNDDYILNVSDLGNNNTYTWQKYGDLIIYIDGNGNPTELWKCVSLNGTHDIMTVEKVADYAKGKQSYQHNIYMYNSTTREISLTIENDDNTQIDKTALKSFLEAKGFTYYRNPYVCMANYDSNVYVGICVSSNDLSLCRLGSGTSIENVSFTIQDTVIPK